MKKARKMREIYDDNYYKAQELLLNPKFQERVKWLKNTFARFDCPIPKEGFKNLQEYMDWNRNVFWKKYADLEASQEYKNKVKEITGGKPTYGTAEYNQIEEFKDKFLPPIYGQYMEGMLEEFGFNRKDEGFKDFLEYHIFLNKQHYPTPLFNIRWIRNPKTEKMELFIELLGHTKKEDIVDHWDWVAQEQKYLPNYMAKNKEWSSFPRDNAIYEIYLRIKAERADGRAKTKNGQHAIDDEIYQRIRQQFGELSLSNIRNIISKVRRFRATPKQPA
jgi:hypothetical protein